MIRAIFFLLGSFVFSVTSLAQGTIKCNPAGGQLEMNACASDDLAEADRELNKTYRALLQKEGQNIIFVRKLRVAQKAWLAFRDADLEAMYACEGDPRVCWGSIGPLCYASYKAKVTRERTKRLRELVDEGPPADACE